MCACPVAAPAALCCVWPLGRRRKDINIRHSHTGPCLASLLRPVHVTQPTSAPPKTDVLSLSSQTSAHLGARLPTDSRGRPSHPGPLKAPRVRMCQYVRSTEILAPFRPSTAYRAEGAKANSGICHCESGVRRYPLMAPAREIALRPENARGSRSRRGRDASWAAMRPVSSPLRPDGEQRTERQREWRIAPSVQ